MAVSLHLGLFKLETCIIGSADPENPTWEGGAKFYLEALSHFSDISRPGVFLLEERSPLPSRIDASSQLW